MQIFANGKWRFHSFLEFYVIHLKVKLKGEKFDQSTYNSIEIINLNCKIELTLKMMFTLTFS